MRAQNEAADHEVQDLAFSPNEKYLATLGGRDDNKLVLWDVEAARPSAARRRQTKPAIQ
jgi:WD40 repeat protein